MKGKAMYAAIAKLVMILDDNNRPYDMNKIKRAYKYAYRLHDGQFRASGEPYIMHPVAVAEIVVVKRRSVVAGLGDLGKFFDGINI